MKIIENKSAYFKYFILETYDAGLVLEGWEVKSIRNFNVQIKNSFIFIENNELFLKESYINLLNNNINSKSNRNRKLLLKNIEIKKILNKTKKYKYIIIPLIIFIKNNYIKIKIAIALKKLFKNNENLQNNK